MRLFPSPATAADLGNGHALLEAGDLGSWLGLFADDCLYWVPGQRGRSDPTSEVLIVYDDRARLAARVARLTSGRSTPKTLHPSPVISF